MKRPSALQALTIAALLAGLVALLLGLPAAGTPGWDAASYALGSLRMAESLRVFDLAEFARELHGDGLNPPLGRVAMSFGFLIGGPGFIAPRAMTCVAWILTLFLASRLARKLVPEDQGDTAAFWTACFGLTSWLGVVHARSAFMEPYSALITVTACLAYLRAREEGRAAWGILGGVLLGAAFLTKFTYGPQLIGAVGLCALVDLVHRGAPPASRRVLPWGLLGLGVVLAWWFLLPLPYGWPMGRSHWANFLQYLDTPRTQSTLGPGFTVVAWLLESFLSLPAFLIAFAGILWGLRHAGRGAPRLCALLALIGPLSFALYPFRVDRFLLPTLPATWALGGALCAVFLHRLSARARLPVAVAVLAVIIGMRGIGDELVTRLAFELPAELPQEVLDNFDEWKHPYRYRPAPASGPEGNERVLDFAAAQLDPDQPFAWIGGTATELSYDLLFWRLFQAHGDRRILGDESPGVAHLWDDPGWDEAAFRKWSSFFPRVVTLDPPDPKNRKGRDFERDYVTWMTRHPGFRVRASEDVLLDGRGHRVTAYERVE